MKDVVERKPISRWRASWKWWKGWFVNPTTWRLLTQLIRISYWLARLLDKFL